ncbi:heavy metal efflux pump, CzcA family [Methylomagnum ishizawai]|uniref:Heavy metal efflux pump, CzcA family n=1 Tax=Methylomagnum ishizawai TaxID=1760988 RepID=A0A1Y6D3Q6_9GAMM|nr:efflux RND transporter permease subunit [Methylomagnum ishizawai]SMF95024.1 heavy metal efflux pump, CzcA family [Methylomagnum ishizawai]
MTLHSSRLGRFAVENAPAIVFICVALCLAGIYAALTLPSSVFPRTDFPRVVVLVDNGVMPADEMMATVTRPIEEAMKDIPGAETLRSATGRGAAEVNIFFDWRTDMVQAEQYVLGRLGQIRASLPPTASASVFRLTFASFPVLGVSLTGPGRAITDLWETARYDIKPRFLRIPGVARVNLVGGRAPEFHVIVDPLALHAANLTLAQVADALNRNNLILPTGMHEENHTLYLAVVDNRARGIGDIENLTVPGPGGRPVPLKEFAHVLRAPEPVFNRVTAEGVDAVLLNVYSQPDGDTLAIAGRIEDELRALAGGLPPALKLALFYDQSVLVRDSVRSVWEAIGFGLLLSMAIIHGFLKTWRTTLTAAAVIPVTVLATLVAMRVAGLSLNLMTLGGITAAIGLIIDDAIVVVEAIHAKLAAGTERWAAVSAAIAEILRPLLGSTLTPVVVFLPLSLLDGIPGVFFRALALTMTVSLLTSLVLAVTLTPSLAAGLMRGQHSPTGDEAGGPLLGRVVRRYEITVRAALRRPGITLWACLAVLLLGAGIYGRLDSDFLPAMDEGGFVIDYNAAWGSSLAETNRQLLQAEAILRSLPEVESYSRRTGARLALAITEPHSGDLLVKLKPDRERDTEAVIAELRERFNAAVPGLEWEFAGILGDLIGDLAWSPKPVEIKLFSTDIAFLKRKAPEIEAKIKRVAGVVDTFDGLAMTGPSLRVRVRQLEAQRLGFSATDVGNALGTAMLGQKASYVLEGDRLVNIRVRLDAASIDRVEDLRNLLLRAPDGTPVKLSQIAAIGEEPSQLELHREDLRQNVAVTARLEGRDLGGAIGEIKALLAGDKTLPPGVLELGGLYRQQQASFHNLLRVLAMAVFLVFTVLLIEFRSFSAPIAIVAGAVLALFGTLLALWLTGTSLNIVSFLGAIIGIGIVAKNGILMLDFVEHLRAGGQGLAEALARSGRRRLRPVLMTSLAAALGLLPLALGVGSGADMLKPLAIAVMGALGMSVLLSLVATPAAYFLLMRSREKPVPHRIPPHG